MDATEAQEQEKIAWARIQESWEKRNKKASCND
jgi:hypothetical protein